MSIEITGQSTTSAGAGAPGPQGPAGTGAITAIQSLDVSTFAGADLGAQINAAQATAPAAGCILDCRNFTSPQILSTAVNITGPHRILAAGLVVTQTAIITLSGANSGIIGTPGRAFIFNKGGNLAEQILISGNDVIVDNIILDGKVASTYTGNGIQINNSTLRPIISNSTIQNQFTDAVHDLGSTDLQILNSYINTAAGVNGYNQLTNANTAARIISTTFVDSAASTGSAVILFSGQIAMVGCRIGTSANIPSINGGNSGGILTVTNCRISNTGGNSSYTGINATATLTDCYLFGGGAGAPNISATTGIFVMKGCIALGQGVNHCVSASGQQNGQLIIAHNQLSQTFTSTGFSIVLMTGDSIGMIVVDNAFLFQDSSPTGPNYGILMQPVAASHFINHIVTGNVLRGASSVDDVGIYLNNAIANTNSSNHNVSFNTFIDMAGGNISRNDTNGYLSALFEENSTNQGPLFNTVAGGTGANDKIISHGTSFTVATLPTCGVGSEVFISDGLPTAPVRSSATGPIGTVGFRVGGAGNWVSATSPVVVQVNTTGITTNVGGTVIVNNAAAGQYLINWNAKITTVGSSSSTLGPFQLQWTDPDGVVQGFNHIAATSSAGVVETSDAGNLTSTVLLGVPTLINVKAGTQISYAFGMTSNASTGAANLNIAIELR